jgi:hypothetical protein
VTGRQPNLSPARSDSVTEQQTLVVAGASGAWHRRLGPLAWAVLEELALVARRDAAGWVAPVAWVRNGDRWQILAHRADGSVLLHSLEQRGRVVLPADYLAANVSLAYAVTVHKSQGLTVDDAILVVDGATAAEHLYVGMTRGRQTNRAFVVCEPADSDHSTGRVPSAHDVLAAALRRSANERSATETRRSATGPLDDLPALQAALEEARRRVDAVAGRDRRGEIDRLRRQTAGHADITRAVADAETRLARLSMERQRALMEVSRAEQGLEHAPRTRRFRRPDKELQLQAEAAVAAAHELLRAVDGALLEVETSLSAACSDQANLGAAGLALQQAETAQHARQAWLDAHPKVVNHIVDLAQTIRRAKSVGRFQYGGATANQRDPRFRAGTEPSLRRRSRPAYPRLTPPSGAEHHLTPLSDSAGPGF